MKTGTILITLAVTGAFLAAFTRQVWKPAEKPQTVGEFIPTNEWQEVLPGQAIPKGLKIRMDFNTHKKFAKLDDGVDNGENHAVLVAETSESTPAHIREMSEEEKLAKVITDSIVNKDPKMSNETPDQMKERVLLSLPEPLEELKGISLLSEEEKKRLIDQVWERRQKALAEAMKSVRGDADIMMERLGTLRDLSSSISGNLNETQETLLQQTLADLQWLILDVDNAEDLLKMDGESLLVQVFCDLASLPAPSEEVLKESIVVVATLYKNALSISSFTLATRTLHSLMALLDSPRGQEAEQVRRKVFYALAVLTGKYPAMSELFVQGGGVVLLEKAVASASGDEKRRALQMYRQLSQQHPTLPSLSTVNVCSQCMEDLVSREWRSDTPLLEAYVEFLHGAKEQGERSCLDQLLQSEAFMAVMKDRYEDLRQQARQEMIEEGEEGYYTNMVKLLHSVFGERL